MRTFLIICFACLIANTSVSAQEEHHNWPNWRGPHRTGIAASDQNPPLTWSNDENIAWKSPVLGRGHGSPTIYGDKVFLATADERKQVQYVLCYERETGRRLWRREVHRGPLNFKNKKASQASSTIACDGERIFVNFLNEGAVYTTALSLEGEQLWQRKVSDYKVHQGYGSSPLLYKSLVIVTADNKAGGAVVAYERDTGTEVWRRDRPKMPDYPSPNVLLTSGKEQLLLSGCELATGLDPLTGRQLWEVEAATTECVTTAVTDGTHVFTSGGYPRNHVAAVKTDGSGEIVWNDPTRVYVPSMIVNDGYLYAVADAGFLVCWKSDTGEVMWKQRLSGNFTASLVMWNGHLFATNETGKTFVVKVSPTEHEIVAENQLGDEAMATPAICGGRVYLRHAEYEGDLRQEYLYVVGR